MLAALVGCCAAVLAVVPGASADLVPFTGYTVTCPSNPPTPTTAPVSSTHREVMMRLTALADGTWGFQVGHQQAFKSGDVVWNRFGSPLQAGESPSPEPVTCSSGSYRIDYFDSPQPPATFSGVTSAGSNSTLALNAGPQGEFVADVAPQDNPITAAGVAGTFVFSAPGTMPLGNGNGVPLTLSVPAGGQTSHWSVTLRQPPVTLTVNGFDAPFARPNGSAHVSYFVNRDVTVNATILNAAGGVVRTLPAQPAGSNAPQPTVWDGLGNGGARLPDGAYRAHLVVTDSESHTAAGDATVTLDGTAPVVKMTSPAALAAKSPLVVALSDALSGLRGAYLTVDGAPTTPTTGATLTFATAGLKAGKHQWTATAVDNAGNTATASGTFTLASSRPGLPCGTRAAVRPASCGVHGLKLRSLHWSSWTSTSAKATGKLKARSVRIVADRPRTDCNGNLVFTRVRITGHAIHRSISVTICKPSG